MVMIIIIMKFREILNNYDMQIVSQLLQENIGIPG